MNGLNRVFLMGRLGSAPKRSLSKNGRPYTLLSIATNRHYRDDKGQKQTHTDWHHVTVWGPQSDSCAQYLDKGHPVLVEGYLTYFDKALEEGGKTHQVAIHATQVRFLPGRPVAAPDSNNDPAAIVEG
ncbi:MAG: single-stranded DNA-binding protein [Pseudobdellovibrionaceae bacterium]|nr:single-stranded DNA-binding protein [Bdellovibrionales bacterium]USN46435.1 MAG: single-stranded DNA-binding protein [Pseudobdellovibrionaceae bacterium]